METSGVWQPTLDLRFLEQPVGSGGYRRILQQKWVDLFGNFAWRDVPLVKLDG